MSLQDNLNRLEKNINKESERALEKVGQVKRIYKAIINFFKRLFGIFK